MPVTLTPIESDFYAQHSPFGAFSSFTVGRYGHKGGFGLELGGPAQQDVYVALARVNANGKVATVRALPFYSGAQTGGAEAYTGEDSASLSEDSGWSAYSPEEITRSMGWATDQWSTADGLTFRLITPFGSVPDPQTVYDEILCRSLCPAILAEITVDNSTSDTEALAFFGIGAADPLRILSETLQSCYGIAREIQWGFAIRADSDASEMLSWNLQEDFTALAEGASPAMNHLANRGGLVLSVPPGTTRTFTIALGFYRSGVVTSGIKTSYLYNRLFPDLESVLDYALENADEWKNAAAERDAELDAAALSDSRKFLLAHATHSYYGSTMLLQAENGDMKLWPDGSYHRPLWVVNEGEYRMMNTFDLTVDHAFWELRYHPWTLRNTLDLFVARYRYYDEVQDATDEDRPHFIGGISFTHDMGVANQFSPPGYSSYERPNLSDCFSYMTGEQLMNWCLTAALYGITNNDKYWLGVRHDVLIACLHSMINRDGPEGMRNGILSLDSSRCGYGQEITTYDSLDASLGQARGNAYLAVKNWAAYLALSRCFDLLGHEEPAAIAEEQAAIAAQCIAGHFNHEQNFLPAIFDDGSAGNTSRIVPAIEGLAFPYLLGDQGAVSEDGPFGELISLLRIHLQTVLKEGTCIDSISGGIKMSSTSENTWMSKIFLSQWVGETVLRVEFDPKTDEAHKKWQTQGQSRDFAFTDQVRSTDGTDLGSRYYPRGVTAVLWLK